MYRITFILILTGILIFPLESFSQRYLQKGDEAFEREQYKLAIDNYTKQFEKSDKSQKTRAESSYKLGQCYIRLSEPKQAIHHLQNALKYNYKDSDIYFDLSNMYLQHEEFDSAIITLETYEKLVPNNPRTDIAIKRIQKTLEIIEKPNDYKVNIFSIVNSGELDFSPFYGYKDYEKLFFTSSRSLINNPNINYESGELFTDIYESEQNKDGSWTVPIKSLGSLNTEYDEGTASLNRRYNILYFSRCTYNPKKDIACKIYTAKRRSSYWSEIHEVVIPGIPENISIGHPSISDDELTLYFVADSLLGGYGGKDIYKVTRNRKSQKFSAPSNLGPDVNSNKDDCFPYVRKDGTLYFASAGHGSIGGLDIFSTKQLSSSEYIVENMGSPINSPADDFGIVFKDESEEGFFTSQRRGGVGKSDIYHFSLPNPNLFIDGIVWDKTSNSPLINVNVSLCDQSGHEILSKKTDKFGKYNFKLEKDNIYQIYFSKDPYLPESERISTKNTNNIKHFKKEIFLRCR